jgi:bifunctional DNase/RNase
MRSILPIWVGIREKQGVKMQKRGKNAPKIAKSLRN